MGLAAYIMVAFQLHSICINGKYYRPKATKNEGALSIEWPGFFFGAHGCICIGM